ncbi:MAG: DUF2723 domain-containing protein [Bacteroidota bacterium]
MARVSAHLPPITLHPTMRYLPQVHTLISWGLFASATAVYTCTLEPTASFWDCSEYIASAYQLQVTHPPGAPLFLLLARLFALLAGRDTTQVAFWVNMSAALASAGSVMVVSWIIRILAEKLDKRTSSVLPPRRTCTPYAIWAARLVGGWTLTFCSTFWLTATEAETYAASVLVMCLMVWAMLQWERIHSTTQAYRWFFFIAYLIGLSLGLRTFSLLALPSVCLIFYFKKTDKPTPLGIVATVCIGGLMILGIQMGIVIGLPTCALWLELLCVNKLGGPLLSGVLLGGTLLISLWVCVLRYTQCKQRVRLHAGLLCIIFVLIGYSTYMLVPIRAHADLPINENDPSDVASFIAYLRRDQYGQRPLLYGPHFAAQPIGQHKDTPVYTQIGNQYVCAGHRYTLSFHASDYLLFPRVWSQLELHVAAYRQALGLQPWQSPTWVDNLKFLCKHQLGYFYLRYLLWNFSGRASDTPGASWLTPLDALRQPPLPIANNPGRVNYLGLPLFLGWLGLLWQYKHDKRAWGVLLTLFFMLGVALVLFLNPPPIEPRERDYIYVGSFLAYTIWIGLGTLAVIDYVQRIIPRPTLAAALGTTLCLSVPTIMAAQGWQAHNRSHRYFSVDSAKNLLSTCAPHAILFTGGDNDTFPLWYVQEVEGFRTDVRVIVLTYANTDWYIRQMQRQVHESAPIPFSIPPTEYRQYGLNDFLPYVPQPDLQGPVDIPSYLQRIRESDSRLQITNAYAATNTAPSQVFRLAVDKADLGTRGVVPKALQDKLVDQLVCRLKGHGLEKKDLFVLDVVATNNWERPIYFNHTSLYSLGIDLRAYAVAEGTALRIWPVRYSPEEAQVNTAAMYDHLMHRSYWRGLDNPAVYYDDHYRGLVTNHRLAFSTLAKALLQAGVPEKAREVLDRCREVMPDAVIPYDAANVYMIELFFELGDPQSAVAMANTMGERAEEVLDYAVRVGYGLDREVQRNLMIVHEIAKQLTRGGWVELGDRYWGVFYECCL